MATQPSDTGIAELDKLIHTFEFENQQLVKMIEKENQFISSLRTEMEEKRAERKNTEKEISRFDEDSKRLHSLHINSVDNTSSLRNTIGVMKEHHIMLNRQMESLKLKNDESNKTYKDHTTSYSNTRNDYMKVYKSFPLALELEDVQLKIADTQAKMAEDNSVRDAYKDHISTTEAEFDTKVMTRIAVKLADTKLINQKKEREIHDCHTEKTLLLQQLKEIQSTKVAEQSAENVGGDIELEAIGSEEGNRTEFLCNQDIGKDNLNDEKECIASKEVQLTEKDTIQCVDSNSTEKTTFVVEASLVSEKGGSNIVSAMEIDDPCVEKQTSPDFSTEQSKENSAPITLRSVEKLSSYPLCVPKPVPEVVRPPSARPLQNRGQNPAVSRKPPYLRLPSVTVPRPPRIIPAVPSLNIPKLPSKRPSLVTAQPVPPSSVSCVPQKPQAATIRFSAPQFQVPSLKVQQNNRLSLATNTSTSVKNPEFQMEKARDYTAPLKEAPTVVNTAKPSVLEDQQNEQANQSLPERESKKLHIEKQSLAPKGPASILPTSNGSSSRKVDETSFENSATEIQPLFKLRTCEPSDNKSTSENNAVTATKETSAPTFAPNSQPASMFSLGNLFKDFNVEGGDNSAVVENENDKNDNALPIFSIFSTPKTPDGNADESWQGSSAFNFNFNKFSQNSGDAQNMDDGEPTNLLSFFNTTQDSKASGATSCFFNLNKSGAESDEDGGFILFGAKGGNTSSQDQESDRPIFNLF